MDYLKGNSLEDEGSPIEGKCAMECNSAGNVLYSVKNVPLLS